MFLRIFSVCGSLFGLASGAMVVLQGGGIRQAIFLGLSSGVFFGLVMAVVLGTRHRRQMEKRGFDPDVEGSAVDVRASVALPVPPGEALARCRAALEANTQFQGVRLDPASGTVHAQGRMTWDSFGEVIECRVHPGDGGSRVDIRSRPRMRLTLVDYGKNRENVEHIRAFLAGSAPAEALAPAEPALAGARRGACDAQAPFPFQGYDPENARRG